MPVRIKDGMIPSDLSLNLTNASKSDFYSMCSTVYPALLPILEFHLDIRLEI